MAQSAENRHRGATNMPSQPRQPEVAGFNASKTPQKPEIDSTELTRHTKSLTLVSNPLATAVPFSARWIFFD